MLSAYGIGLADVKAVREASWLKPLGQDFSAGVRALEAAARSDLVDRGSSASKSASRRRARLRTPGSDTTMVVRSATAKKCATLFEALHRKRFGYVDEAETDRRHADGRCDCIFPCLCRGGDHAQHGGAAPPSALRAATSPRKCEGRRSLGPALIFEASSTIVVEPGWQAERARDGTLVLTRAVPLERSHAVGTEVDPVRLEIFNNLFMAIAEEMGVALQSTATSRQHQGTAGFQLRDLRRIRRADRQCAAYPGSPWLDGREHPHHHRHSRRWARRARHPPRRCLCPQRSLSRRDAPAGHHGDRPGLL